jgi:hypothetical protein
MSTKADRLALQKLKDVHFKKYGAKLGKRKCNSNYADGCLGTADETEFRGCKCLVCVRQLHRERYTARLAEQGLERTGRGRLIGSKYKTKRKSREICDDTESDDDE